MSAAVLQGVPATTFDTDIWIDLPSRQYIKVINICHKQGAQLRSNTVVDLTDGSTVNFLYEVHGLHSFAYEFERACTVRWLGHDVRVLPLKRILRSKLVVRRPKDLAHIPLLRDTIRLQHRLKRKAASAPGP